MCVMPRSTGHISSQVWWRSTMEVSSTHNLPLPPFVYILHHFGHKHTRNAPFSCSKDISRLRSWGFLLIYNQPWALSLDWKKDLWSQGKKCHGFKFYVPFTFSNNELPGDCFSPSILLWRRNKHMLRAMWFGIYCKVHSYYIYQDIYKKRLHSK